MTVVLFFAVFFFYSLKTRPVVEIINKKSQRVLTSVYCTCFYESFFVYRNKKIQKYLFGKPDSQNMVAMDTLNSNNYLLGP